MRDGTIFRADIYRPQTDAPLPVLLQRTPYGKGFSQTSFALMAAERGYAVVLQDTRGRWASDGDGYPLVHEQQDGYDTVAMVRRTAVVGRARGDVRGILRGLHSVRRRLSAPRLLSQRSSLPSPSRSPMT